MKFFLTQLAKFTVISIIFSILLYVILDWANSQLINEYKISKEVNKLIIGDSHVQKAIDDKLLPKSLNVSQSSQGLMFSYYILNALLKNNPGIDTVMLGISYHSFSSYYNEYIYNPDIAYAYYFILPVNDQFEFLVNMGFHNIPGLMINSIKGDLKNLIYRILKKEGKYSFIGNYNSFTTNVRLSEKTIATRITNQYYDNGNLKNFSYINIFYYYKILKLCQGKDIKLIGLRLPMHIEYYNRIPQKFKNNFKFLTKNTNLDLIEFSDLKLRDNDFLPDGDHLTITGTYATTKYLEQILRNKNLKKLK